MRCAEEVKRMDVLFTIVSKQQSADITKALSFAVRLTTLEKGCLGSNLPPKAHKKNMISESFKEQPDTEDQNKRQKREMVEIESRTGKSATCRGKKVVLGTSSCSPRSFELPIKDRLATLDTSYRELGNDIPCSILGRTKYLLQTEVVRSWSFS